MVFLAFARTHFPKLSNHSVSVFSALQCLLPKFPLLSYSEFTSSRGLLRWKSRLTHTFRNIWHVTCDMWHDPWKTSMVSPSKGMFHHFSLFPPGLVGSIGELLRFVKSSHSVDSANKGFWWARRFSTTCRMFFAPQSSGSEDVGTVISVLFQAWHKNPKLSRLTTVLGWILVFWQIIQHWSKFQQLKTQFSGSSLVISLGYNAVIPKHNSLKGLKDEYLVGRIPF